MKSIDGDMLPEELIEMTNAIGLDEYTISTMPLVSAWTKLEESVKYKEEMCSLLEYVKTIHGITDGRLISRLIDVYLELDTKEKRECFERFIIEDRNNVLCENLEKTFKQHFKEEVTPLTRD